jgi:hypothetical protein
VKYSFHFRTPRAMPTANAPKAQGAWGGTIPTAGARAKPPTKKAPPLRRLQLLLLGMTSILASVLEKPNRDTVPWSERPDSSLVLVCMSMVELVVRGRVSESRNKPLIPRRSLRRAIVDFCEKVAPSGVRIYLRVHQTNPNLVFLRISKGLSGNRLRERDVPPR